MGRYAVTAVFEVGPGKVPHGADVLDRMQISDKATHRFSYCDGRTLTVVIDWTSAAQEQASADVVLAVRLVWAQLTGTDPGKPLSLRVRSLTPVERVSAGVRRGLETVRPGRRTSADTALDRAPDLPRAGSSTIPTIPTIRTTAVSPASASPAARSPGRASCRQPARSRASTG